MQAQGSAKGALYKNLMLLAFTVLICAAFLEIGCQIFYRARLAPAWLATRRHPNHYFTNSACGTLAYELAPDRTLVEKGRTLHVNRWGLRDADSDLAQDRVKVVILGDSVVFGIDLSQDETISWHVQQKLDPSGQRVKVLNWGIPGYGFEELLQFLQAKNAIYGAQHVVYLLNPNDFSRRDTVYEGADNGLYRMYQPPRWKSLWFLRKAIYRFYKQGLISVGWYRWIFEGNKRPSYEIIGQIARYCRDHQATFAVVLLPAGCAYRDGAYQLAAMYDEIAAELGARGIPCCDPRARFAADPSNYFTVTDHLYPAGNLLITDVISELLGPLIPPPTGQKAETP